VTSIVELQFLGSGIVVLILILYDIQLHLNNNSNIISKNSASNYYN